MKHEIARQSDPDDVVTAALSGHRSAPKCDVTAGAAVTTIGSVDEASIPLRMRDVRAEEGDSSNSLGMTPATSIHPVERRRFRASCIGPQEITEPVILSDSEGSQTTRLVAQIVAF